MIFPITRLIGSITTMCRPKQAEWGSFDTLEGSIWWLNIKSYTDFHALVRRVATRCFSLCFICSVTMRWLHLIDLFEPCIDCVGLSCSLSVINDAWYSPDVSCCSCYLRWNWWICFEPFPLQFVLLMPNCLSFVFADWLFLACCPLRGAFRPTLAVH